jgi:hypothetical protein
MISRALRAAALVVGPLSLAGHAAAKPSALKKSSDALAGAEELKAGDAEEKGGGHTRNGSQHAPC